MLICRTELVISQVGGYSLAELQGLSKANRAPFVMFTPRNTGAGPDASNMARYSNMSTALARGSNVSSNVSLLCRLPGCSVGRIWLMISQMATINITQDRGLAIFSPPQTGPDGEARQSRLMGLVCMVSNSLDATGYLC